jgi:PAS domain S-box-containing protein
MKLKHIVKDVITIKGSQNVLALLEMMKENKISSVVVLNKAGKIYGIFTESDAIKAVALGFNLQQMQVKEFVGKHDVFSLPEETYLFEAFNQMQGQGYRHVIAVDSQNCVKGIATQSDFLKYLDTQVLVKIKSVEDVMIKDVVTADENYSVNDAALIMFENKISSLIVVNQLDKPVGIVTERDMVDFALQSSNVRLHEVMSKPLLTTTKDEPLHSVLEKMEQFQIRRFVIVDNDENIVGLVTRSNILRSIQAKKIEILAKTLKEKNRELEIIKKQDEELKLLDTALKSSANAVVITDVNANIKWCNSAFEKLTGYQKEEVLGKRPKELLKSGVHTKTFYDSLWNTILAKQSFKGEVVNRKKNGDLYTENLTITPLLDSKGEITHFVAVKEDITQLKKLQQSIIESEKRFKNLFEQAPLPYQSLDKDGYIVEVNKAWLQMSGYSYKEVIGSHISQYICKDELKLLQTTFSSFLLEGEVRGQVFKFLTKSGEDKII